MKIAQPGIIPVGPQDNRLKATRRERAVALSPSTAKEQPPRGRMAAFRLSEIDRTQFGPCNRIAEFVERRRQRRSWHGGERAGQFQRSGQTAALIGRHIQNERETIAIFMEIVSRSFFLTAFAVAA